MNRVPGSWLLALGNSRRALPLRSVAALAVVIFAVSGPVAQLLRVEEVAAPRTGTRAQAAPQYRLVWAEGQAKNQDQKTKSHEQDQKPPRLLKPLADQWESALRIQIGAGEVPPPVAEPYVPNVECARVAAATTVYYPSHSPPNPPARGPPLTF